MGATAVHPGEYNCKTFRVLSFGSGVVDVSPAGLGFVLKVVVVGDVVVIVVAPSGWPTNIATVNSYTPILKWRKKCF